MQSQGRALVVVAMALVLVALAWILLERPETGPPLPDPTPEVERPEAATVGAALEGDGDDDDDVVGATRSPSERREGSGRPRAGDEQGEATAAATTTRRAPRTEPLDLEPWDDDAEVRAQLLEQAVETVLANVAPELGDAVLERSCDADGNLCVFEGPWPGDDFLGRWVSATGRGDFLPEDLNGVTFQKVERIEHADGQRYSITAVAPE